jgi:hypothetical protein
MFVQQVASKTGDVQLADFVESEFLGEQVCMKSLLQLTIFLCLVQEIVHNCVTHEIQILPFNYYFSFHRWKPSKKSPSMLLS